MSDKWDEMRRVKEEEYFNKQNQEALDRIKQRQHLEQRLSPVTGEPMVPVTLMGVVVDRCPSTGGIWLDAGELEQIIKASQQQQKEEKEGWLYNFLNSITDIKLK